MDTNFLLFERTELISLIESKIEIFFKEFKGKKLNQELKNKLEEINEGFGVEVKLHCSISFFQCLEPTFFPEKNLRVFNLLKIVCEFNPKGKDDYTQIYRDLKQKFLAIGFVRIITCLLDCFVSSIEAIGEIQNPHSTNSTNDLIQILSQSENSCFSYINDMIGISSPFVGLCSIFYDSISPYDLAMKEIKLLLKPHEIEKTMKQEYQSFLKTCKNQFGIFIGDMQNLKLSDNIPKVYNLYWTLYPNKAPQNFKVDTEFLNDLKRKNLLQESKMEIKVVKIIVPTFKLPEFKEIEPKEREQTDILHGLKEIESKEREQTVPMSALKGTEPKEGEQTDILHGPREIELKEGEKNVKSEETQSLNIMQRKGDTTKEITTVQTELKIQPRIGKTDPPKESIKKQYGQSMKSQKRIAHEEKELLKKPEPETRTKSKEQRTNPQKESLSTSTSIIKEKTFELPSSEARSNCTHVQDINNELKNALAPGERNLVSILSNTIQKEEDEQLKQEDTSNLILQISILTGRVSTLSNLVTTLTKESKANKEQIDLLIKENKKFAISTDTQDTINKSLQEQIYYLHDCFKILYSRKIGKAFLLTLKDYYNIKGEIKDYAIISSRVLAQKKIHNAKPRFLHPKINPRDSNGKLNISDDDFDKICSFFAAAVKEGNSIAHLDRAYLNNLNRSDTMSNAKQPVIKTGLENFLDSLESNFVKNAIKYNPDTKDSILYLYDLFKDSIMNKLKSSFSSPITSSK